MGIKKYKAIKICLPILCITIGLLLILYVMPSKWLVVSDDIISISIDNVTENKTTTIYEQDKIRELITLIDKTMTQKRIFFPQEIDYMGPDSGFIITVNFFKSESSSVYYSLFDGGLIYYGKMIKNISFPNKKLHNLLLDYTSKN